MYQIFSVLFKTTVNTELLDSCLVLQVGSRKSVYPVTVWLYFRNKLYDNSHLILKNFRLIRFPVPVIVAEEVLQMNHKNLFLSLYDTAKGFLVHISAKYFSYESLETNASLKCEWAIRSEAIQNLVERRSDGAILRK